MADVGLLKHVIMPAANLLNRTNRHKREVAVLGNELSRNTKKNDVINRAETAAEERRRNGSRRRSEGYETNVIINPRMEVANERRANEHQPAFSRQQPSQDERAYPSFDRFTAKKS